MSYPDHQALKLDQWAEGAWKDWGISFHHPGPYKCPECGVWWVGFEHVCVWDYSTGGNYPDHNEADPSRVVYSR
jgi:hypothetical protein